MIYTNTSFGQKFINYLDSVNFNFLPIYVKKNIQNHNIKIKKCINNILFNELGVNVYNLIVLSLLKKKM